MPGSTTRDYERIADIVSQIFGVKTNQVTAHTHFARDLGADELDRMELLYELEEEFCVRIPDAAAKALQTIDDALQLMQETQEK